MSHELHDSGEREQFSTGAQRDTRTGKGRYDLISPLANYRKALVLEKGNLKYQEEGQERNWEQGMPMSRLMDSALRHLNQFLAGERDEDHLAQASFNIDAMIHFDEIRARNPDFKPDLFDLPSYPLRTPKEKPNDHEEDQEAASSPAPKPGAPVECSCGSLFCESRSGP